VSEPAGLRERLRFLADVVIREAQYLAQTDQRLFGSGFGIADVTSLANTRDLAERVDALQPAHGAIADLTNAAAAMSARANAGSLA